MNIIIARKLIFISILLLFYCNLNAQVFKIVVGRFEDRTGRITKSEGEIKANIQAGGIIGSNAGAVAASGQRTDSQMESEKGDLGFQAADLLITELVRAENFKVVDNNLFQQKLNELQVMDYVEAAKQIGAHYLVTGNITEAGVSETGGSLLGFGGKSVEGKVHLNILMTNTSTGEIVLAEGSEGIESEGGVTLFGSDIASKQDIGLLISAALRNAVDSCVMKIISAAGDLHNYPVECDIVLNEGKIYFSKGSDDGISAGDKFEVIGFGKPIKIGNKTIQEKNKKGTITVNEVFADYSISLPEAITVTEGDIAAKIVLKE
ncbi:MAG: CsgG/HfaB family protein [Ignavibacteriaceae bacterium]